MNRKLVQFVGVFLKEWRDLSQSIHTGILLGVGNDQGTVLEMQDMFYNPETDVDILRHIADGTCVTVVFEFVEGKTDFTIVEILYNNEVFDKEYEPSHMLLLGRAKRISVDDFKNRLQGDLTAMDKRIADLSVVLEPKFDLVYTVDGESKEMTFTREAELFFRLNLGGKVTQSNTCDSGQVVLLLDGKVVALVNNSKVYLL